MMKHLNKIISVSWRFIKKSTVHFALSMANLSRKSRYLFLKKISLSDVENSTIKSPFGFILLVYLSKRELLQLNDSQISKIKFYSRYYTKCKIRLTSKPIANLSEQSFYKNWYHDYNSITAFLENYQLQHKLAFLNKNGLDACLYHKVQWLNKKIPLQYGLLVFLFVLILSIAIAYYCVKPFYQQVSLLAETSDDIYPLVLEQESNIYQLEYFYAQGLKVVADHPFTNRKLNKKIRLALNTFIFHFFDKNFNRFLNADVRRWAYLSLKHGNLQKIQQLRRVNFALQYTNKRLLVNSAQVEQFILFFKHYFDFELSKSFVVGYFDYLNRQQSHYIFVPDKLQTYLDVHMHSYIQLYHWFAAQECEKYGYAKLLNKQILQADQSLPFFMLLKNESLVAKDLQAFIDNIHKQPWLWRQFALQKGALYNLLWLHYQLQHRQAWLRYLNSIHASKKVSFAQLFDEIKHLIRIANVNLQVNFDYPWDNYQRQIQSLNAHWQQYALQDKPLQAMASDARLIFLNKKPAFIQQYNTIEKPLLAISDSEIAQSYNHVLQLPFDHFMKLLMQHAAQYYATIFHQQVYPFYAKHLQSFFPFALTAADAQVSDVKQFLQDKQGLFWRFFAKNLAPFYVKQQAWHKRTWHGILLPTSKTFTLQLNDFQALTDITFKRSCLIKFSFYPIPLPQIVSFTLAYANRRMIYQNGPQIWQSFCWPYQSQSLRYRLHFSHQVASKIMQFNGHWAPLRLFMSANSPQHPFSVLIKPAIVVNIVRMLNQQKNYLELIDHAKILP